MEDKRSRLYSLNKDLLVKVIEEVGDYKQWDFSKVSDNDLEFLEKRIQKEKRDRNFNRKAENVRKELREYLIDIGEFNEEIETLLNLLYFSRGGIRIKTGDADIHINYTDMGSLMWLNEEQLFKKFGDFSYIIEWVISIAKNRVNGLNVFFQIKEYLTDDTIHHTSSCINL